MNSLSVEPSFYRSQPLVPISHCGSSVSLGLNASWTAGLEVVIHYICNYASSVSLTDSFLFSPFFHLPRDSHEAFEQRRLGMSATLSACILHVWTRLTHFDEWMYNRVTRRWYKVDIASPLEWIKVHTHQDREPRLGLGTTLSDADPNMTIAMIHMKLLMKWLIYISWLKEKSLFTDRALYR